MDFVISYAFLQVDIIDEAVHRRTLHRFDATLLETYFFKCQQLLSVILINF